MSSQNLFLDQRMKGKESFPYTVPWREGLARGVKVGVFVAVAMSAVSVSHADDFIMGGVLVTRPNENVVVTCLGKEAAYTSYLYFQDPRNNTQPFVCNSAAVGQQLSLGSFSREREVIFKLAIADTGYNYFTGSWERNPDGRFHALIKPTASPDKWYFGFEDLFGGGDNDYDDCMFYVTGLKALSYPSCGTVPVKVWADKNGNQLYDTGEEVSGASVYVNNETSPKGSTNAAGVIQLSSIVATNKIYAEKTFFSVSNPKAVDSNFGGVTNNNPYAVAGIDKKAYNFVMASDVMRKLDGKYYDFPTNGDVCGSKFMSIRDEQGNVLIQLVHPKIEWNLVVAFQEAQTTGFYDQIRTGFRSYADFMYNYTDGYSVVKNVVLVTDRFEGTSQWDYSDVQVKNSEWPNAHIFGNRSNGLYHIHMGKTWSGDGPTGYNWYSTLGHESGHYLFGFYDEYLSGNGLVRYDTWLYRTQHDGNPSTESNEFPFNYGIMDYQYTVHELSDTTDYFPRGTYNLDQVTKQYYLRSKKSTWDFLRTTYQNEIQNKMSGQGFSTAFFNNLILPPHLAGSYPTSDSTKRAGPNGMNHDAITFKSGRRGEERDDVSFIEWTAPSNTKAGEREQLFDATIQVVDNSGTPIPQSEVWLVSAEDVKHLQGKTNYEGKVISNSVGLGKRLEAYSEGRKTELTVVEKTNHYLLTLSSPGIREGQRSGNGLIVSAQPDETQPSKLVIGVAGETLASQPSVTLSQPESYVATVPMETQANDSYFGLVEYQYPSGTLEVVSGDSQSISAFEMFSTEVLLASGFPAPNGELLMTTTSESFEGSGEFIITTSTAPAPANGDLVPVGNVWSFNFAKSITAVHNVGLEILLSADKMKGLDATQLNLYGWDQVTKMWQLVVGGSTHDLKSFNITLASLNYASYALFAPASDDTMAPDAITDLQAKTGDSRWRINLQWTAPSDDKGVYVYEIRFNTVPVTMTNWNDSFAIRTIPNDTAETFVLEMPDPNKNYYFAIRAADAASNWSPMGTLNAPTKSQSSDTDEDGMLDKWEIKYFGSLSHDGTADTDGDLFTDLEEFEAGTDPTVPNTVGPYSVLGKILDEQGNPIPEVVIQLGDKTTTSDAAGNWQISSLPEGTYTVTASKDGYGFKPETVELGNEEYQYNLVFQSLSSLVVSVKPHQWGTLKQGENITYTMTIVNGGNKPATAVTLTDILPEGTRVVSLQAIDGGSCDATSVTCSLPDLTPGATVRVTLELANDQTKTLVNTVTLSSNEYPADVQKTWKAVQPYLSVTVNDSPDPVQMLKNLHYTLDVELSDKAPTPTATGVKVVTQLPKGVELQQVTTDHGTCDSSALPTLTCQLNDLSIANASDISHANIEIEVQLQDAGLLLLTEEAQVTANEYPTATAKQRTKIFVPPDLKVDLALVIDTTNSMQGEINGVIKAIKDFLAQQVDASQSPLMVLVEFKDDVRVRAFTKDMTMMLKAVEGLKAEGGGLCPEASVEALNIALDHVKDNGVIFFTTDASPYDEANMKALLGRLQVSKVKLNAAVTGDCADKDSWNEVK
ncbi:MAG: hypothetical protein BWK78_05005 [Thiotrichaceae bacterium IS1]|nr:MAG: hypothetical protein BWK78_05005 [Thiotrichaceae bacterium IS1]